MIYSWYDGIITEADDYVGRIHQLSQPHRIYGKASINLTSIRESDAGWFECKVLFPNRTPSSRNNGTWFHLNVSGISIFHFFLNKTNKMSYILYLFRW